MKNIFFFVILIAFTSKSYAQQWDWARKGDGVYCDHYGVCTDANGNVYITGGFFGNPSITFGNFTLTSNGQGDIFLVKYDKNGTVLWAKSYGGSFDDIAHSVTTDAAGNVYITGYYSSSSITFGNTTFTKNNNYCTTTFVLKHDTNGNLIWARSQRPTTCSQTYGIATDANANVYITGKCDGTITFDTVTINFPHWSDFFLMKYDSSGNALWGRGGGGGGGYNDCAYSTTTDQSGNVLVTGVFRDTISIGNYTFQASPFNLEDIFIAKYSPNGNVLWAKWYGGKYYDYGMGIKTDFNGNVFITGSFYSPSINFGNIVLTNTDTTTAPNTYSKLVNADIFLAKLDANGNELWAKNFGGKKMDMGEKIGIDFLGNVYLTGEFEDSTIAFGNFILTNRSDSNCYWGNDILLTKFDQNGNIIWAKSVGGRSEDFGSDICVDLNGVYIAGYSGSPTICFGNDTLTSNSSKVYVAKLFNRLGGTTTEIQEQEINNNINIFPNPTTGKFNIESSENISSIEITNLLGEKVFTSTIDHQRSTIDLSFQPKGIYFVEMISDDIRQTRKIIIE